MLQRYKLRLGDGTVLLVDRDSLGTWLVDRSATVQSDTSGRWRPLKEVVARQRAAARRESRSRPSLHESAPPRRASTPRDESEPLTPAPRADGLPLIPPPPKRETPPDPGAPTLRADGLPLVFPPLPGVRLETPAPTPVAQPPSPAVFPAVPSASEDALAPETTVPVPDPTPAASPLATADEPETFSFDPASLAEPETGSADPTEEAEVDLAPTVIVDVPETVVVVGHDDEVIDTLPDVEPGVPDDHGAAGAELEVRAIGDAIGPTDLPPDETTAIRELPVIPFKPVEEPRRERPAAEWGRATERRPRIHSDREAATTTRSTGAPARGEEDAAPAWADDHRATAAFGWAGALGAVLSRGLEPLNRFERGLPPFVVEEGALTRARNGFRKLLDAAFGWLGGVRTRLAHRPRRAEGPPEPTPAPPDEETALRPTPVSAPFRPDPELPPPRIEQLFVVPVAEAFEIAPAEDVYEDTETGPLLPRVWQWTKLVALLATLVGAATFAAVSWQTWFPAAGQVGQMAFAEIDKHAHARELAERQGRILTEAAERLPYLSPETVRLILSRSPTGSIEVPDIFETACDAADWGSWALSAPEAQELRELRERAIRSLGPVDRARVDEYDRARANGLVFPLDNRLGALLWARGARGLPPQGQERLRELLGKAVAAGISPPGVAASRATPRP